MCAGVCICVTEREKEREGGAEKEKWKMPASYCTVLYSKKKWKIVPIGVHWLVTGAVLSKACPLYSSPSQTSIVRYKYDPVRERMKTVREQKQTPYCSLFLTVYSAVVPI